MPTEDTCCEDTNLGFADWGYLLWGYRFRLCRLRILAGGYLWDITAPAALTILLHCDLSCTIENWEIKNFGNQDRRTLELHRNQDRAISASTNCTINSKFLILVSVKFQSSSILVSKFLISEIHLILIVILDLDFGEVSKFFDLGFKVLNFSILDRVR